MDKDSAKNKTCGSPAVRKSREHDISTPEDVPITRTKRKASPDKNTLRKRMRVFESEQPSTSEEDVSVRRGKRKVREDGEGPTQKKTTKRQRVDLLKDDKETASTSTDTDKEICNTSVTDVCKKATKRKSDNDGEGPIKKKTKKNPELKETREEETKEAELDAKYQQLDQLGEGGCGSVYAGYRKADNLPVAIKHIPKDNIFCKQVDKKGNEISVEVAIMLKLEAGTQRSVGTSAPVSLLDWYDLDQELILVLERPLPSEDLYKYIQVNGGSLQEEEAKIILKQLVEAAVELQNKHIFHRDIKVENILIETSSDIPRVRIIDFGLSCFVKKHSSFRVFYGTSAHIPPEWYINSTYRAGPTTVWQMGVVLFETLHRKTFETTKFVRKRLKISKKLSEDCQDFLKTCLTKDPQQRRTLEELQLHPWLR